MRILRQTLTRQWFDLILSGEKLEEYREIKPYWVIRLVTHHFGWNSKGELWHPQNVGFKHYDAIEFTNGCGNHMPKILIECNGINIGRGKPEWGAPTDKDVFIEQLGKILETKNIKQ